LSPLRELLRHVVSSNAHASLTRQASSAQASSTRFRDSAGLSAAARK
jgi:hypothetical protein